MMRMYDRCGQPMSRDEWTNAVEIPGYKRVASTRMAGGVPWGEFWISTVWLGIDHAFFGGPPLIFETMVFPRGTFLELDMDRYSTEEEALAGHAEMCARQLARLGGNEWTRWQMVGDRGGE